MKKPYTREQLESLRLTKDKLASLDMLDLAEEFGIEESPAENKPAEIINSFNSLLTINPKMLALKEKIKKIARTNINILIMGESGTGKELIARAIHESNNIIVNGKPGTFIDINCAGVPDSLLESEFFGAIKGSYTGCFASKPGYLLAAGHGTLFLDEVAEMPSVMQSKLLRVIDNRTARRIGSIETYQVKCRFISATNRTKESFRLDFFHRVAGIILETIPLRERPEDIKVICESRGLPNFPEEWFGKEWPGNVRELLNKIEEVKILGGYL